MKLDYPNVRVGVRAQALADCIELIAAEIQELQALKPLPTWTAINSRVQELQKLWDELSDAIEDPENEL